MIASQETGRTRVVNSSPAVGRSEAIVIYSTRRRRWRRFVALSLGASCLSSPIAALAQGTPNEIPEVTIFGASTVPVDAPRVGAAVTVITQADIQERGVTTLPDALRVVPGVAVNQTGGRGGLAQVRIRGAEANHTLVVVDGVPINDVNNGDADISNISLEAIERIEVVRGPQSGIWGPNAQAGVINIVTKSGRGLARPEVTARVQGGAYGTLEGSASLRGAVGPFSAAMTVSGMRTDGWVIADRFGTDRKGSRIGSFNGRFGFDPTDWFSLDGTLRLIDRRSQYAPLDFLSSGPTFGFPVTGQGQSNAADLQGRLAATFRMLEGRWTHRFSIDTSQQRTRASDAYTSDLGSLETQSLWSRTERNRAEYRTAYTFETPDLFGARHTVVGGVDWTRERFRYFYESDGLFGPFVNDTYANGRSRERRGLHGEYLLALSFGFSLSAAIRQDWNSNFRNATTWRLTAAQQIESTDTRLHGSIGKGVTNPTFFDQFGFFANFTGNPLLKPEQSIGFDAGVEQRWFGGSLVTDLTYFRANLRDEIVPFSLTVVNSPVETSRHGFEASATWRPAAWLTLTGTYTYTDSRTAETTGGLTLFKDALRRPKHAASFSATALFADNRGRVTLSLAHNGTMRDRFFGTFPPSDVFLRAYTSVGAQLSYDVTRSMTAFVRGENIFGARVQEVFGYRGQVATVSAGLRVRFD